jgi:hypothetical protein
VATLFAIIVSRMLLVLRARADGVRVPRDSRRQAAEPRAENSATRRRSAAAERDGRPRPTATSPIRAQVTEDITGAIADSMNYTDRRAAHAW